MTALPIVERELLVRSRQGRTHWIRVMAGGVAALFSLQFFVLWGAASTWNPTQVAGFAFQTLSWLGFLLACGGCLLTVDCLSSERREGTLDLLLLTRVGTVEVLAGKLAAHGLAAVFGLATLAPALMMPVLAGGVVWEQVTQTVLGLFSVLFFSLCLGLWASSGSQRLAESLSRLAVWFVIIVVLPLLVALMLTVAGAPKLAALFECFSPASAFVHASQSAQTVWGGSQLISLCVGPCYGLWLLVLAARTLRGVSQADVSAEEPSVVPEHARARRRVPAETDPLGWLLRRDRWQLAILWAAAGVNLVMTLARFIFVRGGGLGTIGIQYAMYFGGSVAAAALFAYAGARFPLAARGTGLLELLGTTPVGGTELSSRLWSVLCMRLIGPLALAVGLAVLQRVGYLLALGRGMSVGVPISVLQLLITVASVILHAAALCALGLSLGWRFHRTAAAVLWPVGLVWGLDLLLSYGLYALVAAVAGLVGRGGISSTWANIVSMLVLPIICGAKQVWLILWARRQLKEVLSGLESETFDWRAGIRNILAWIRRMRHWTPSSDGS